MKKLIWLFALLITQMATAQVGEFKQIKYGRLGISIYYHDTLINIGSNRLVVLLDEDSRKLTLRLDPSTLRSGIDSLDAIIKRAVVDEVEFHGTVLADKLWQPTEKPRSFQVEGELTLNGVPHPVTMTGTLRETEVGMGVEGMLHLHFDPVLEEFGVDTMLPGFASVGCVEMLQPVKIGNTRK